MVSQGDIAQLTMRDSRNANERMKDLTRLFHVEEWKSQGTADAFDRAAGR